MVRDYPHSVQTALLVRLPSMENTIAKSTRHSEILGKFGEYVVCNWLSRSGFEVCVINHTGLDIIAYHPKSKHRLGITVKSRTRKLGKESESVNIFSRKGKDREKLQSACKSFDCKPWLAIYVECGKTADLYLSSLVTYDSKYRSKKARAIDAWSMTKKPTTAYASDPNVSHIHFEIDNKKWPPLR
jgi:Holliday junction resolvase-like predicted endonuclease